MVSLLNSMPCDEFNVLYDMLENISISIKKGESSRRGFGAHRATTFGMVRGRYNGILGLSHSSHKYPDIYKEILRIGSLIDMKFNAIHLNHNVVCPKHLDSNNYGDSVLISFGEYEGCNIVIEDKKYDAFCQPIKFDGSKLYHWNTNDLIGNKYSLVFYYNKSLPDLTRLC